MRRDRMSCGLLVVWAASGCTASPDLEAEREALLAADAAWAAAAGAGDIATLGTYWAEEAKNYFPGAPVAQGRESILELVGRNRSIPGFALTWQATDAVLSSSADLGYTTGPFQLSTRSPDGADQVRTGHYVAIWRKAPDGNWVCVVESTIFGPQNIGPPTDGTP